MIGLRTPETPGRLSGLKSQLSSPSYSLFALPARLAAQTRTNLAGSVTSESMTALWVRETEVYSRSTAWTCNIFLCRAIC